MNEHRTGSNDPDEDRDWPTEADKLWRSYFSGLAALLEAGLSVPSFHSDHLLAFLQGDLEQSARVFPLLLRHRILSTTRRELRFILEASIKICFIEQSHPELSIEQKLDAAREELDTARISRKNAVRLGLLSTAKASTLRDDVGRLHGHTSDYVHLSHAQVMQRVRETFEESYGDVDASTKAELLTLATRALGGSLVFLLHSIPEPHDRQALALFRKKDSSLLGAAGEICPSWL